MRYLLILLFAFISSTTTHAEDTLFYSRVEEVTFDTIPYMVRDEYFIKAYNEALMAKAVGQRNEIECSFGTGKRVYQANDIRAKLPETAECWTGMCYFAKNVMKFFRELCHTLYDLLRFLTLVAFWRGGLRPVRLVAVN